MVKKADMIQGQLDDIVARIIELIKAEVTRQMPANASTELPDEVIFTHPFWMYVIIDKRVVCYEITSIDNNSPMSGHDMFGMERIEFSSFSPQQLVQILRELEFNH